MDDVLGRETFAWKKPKKLTGNIIAAAILYQNERIKQTSIPEIVGRSRGEQAPFRGSTFGSGLLPQHRVLF